MMQVQYSSSISAIELIVTPDILLVSDDNNAYPPCAAAMGVRHEALNLSKGERVRGTIHIQTVNNRPSRLKAFLRRYNGVSTKFIRSIREAYCYAIICLHYMRRLYLHWCAIFYPNHKVLCIFQCYGVMSGNTPRE